MLALTSRTEALHCGSGKRWDSTSECTDAGADDGHPCRLQCHHPILSATTDNPSHHSAGVYAAHRQVCGACVAARLHSSVLAWLGSTSAVSARCCVQHLHLCVLASRGSAAAALAGWAASRQTPRGRPPAPPCRPGGNAPTRSCTGFWVVLERFSFLVGARYPVAVESGGHSMRQLDARDVLEGLRIQDRQLAAIGGPVIDITHEHAVVLGRIGR
jgi:hypothetical protein